MDNELKDSEEEEEQDEEDLGSSTSKIEIVYKEKVLEPKIDHNETSVSAINQSVVKFNNSPRQEIEKKREKSYSPKLSRIASINKRIREQAMMNNQ